MTHPDSRQQMQRAVLSSYLGSVIEFYDFLLFSTAAAVVFNKVFFANLDPLVGTVAAFATLATGYLARPLGGLIFGHFGDRLGRKRMLVLSMLVMGVGSTLIGLLPTSAQIGAWAPILLVTLRILQGVAVGGEWGGAALMSAEHATNSRRGLWASFTQAGGPTGLILSTLAMTATAAVVGEQAFLDWGWRIPFLFSIALLVVGLWVRKDVAETPVFAETAAAAGEPAAVPLVQVLRHHLRHLALSIGVGFGTFVPQATVTAFVVAYAVQVGFPRQTVLNTVTFASVGIMIGVIGSGALSDRFGRRPLVLVSSVAMAAWGFVMFPLIDSRSTVWMVVAIVVGCGVNACTFGPLPALYAELFPTSARYTGASLGYQIAGVGAGLTPVVFASVLATGGSSLLLSILIAAACLLTVCCILALRETVATDLRSAQDHRHSPRAVPISPTDGPGIGQAPGPVT